MPWPQKTFAAFIFDMDGTLINSIASVNRVWSRWALSHSLDPVEVLRVMHGVRAVETIRKLLPQIDAEQEAAKITQLEIDDNDGIQAISGAGPLLEALPPERWAVATSAPRELAVIRLRSAGIPQPRVLVTADDVTRGKPAPDCFLLAAQHLGVPADDCLVWEDTHAGVTAAEAAGADVMVVSATHDVTFETHHPVVVDYQGVAVAVEGTGRVRLTRNA